MKNCGNMMGIWDMMMSWQKDGEMMEIMKA
jgi:hypothetical protein